MLSFPFIGLGVGAWIGMGLKGDETNGMDLGIIPALAGFGLGGWAAYKLFSREDGSDWSGWS